MARYECPRRGHVSLWVVERIGRVIWTRHGKAGTRGRVREEELATAREARDAEARAIAAKLKAGYVLADPAAGVSSAFVSDREREAAVRLLEPSDLARKLASVLAARRASHVLHVSDVADAFVEVAAQPCAWRLTGVDFSSNREASSVTFEARFGKGSGRNPDRYAIDGYRISIELSTTGATDLDDGVGLDVFGDELRLGSKALAARFRRALDDARVFRTLAHEVARSFRIDRR